MSIATEIQRLQQAKSEIKTAIENKGVTVGDGTIDTYAEKICEISAEETSQENYLNYVRAVKFGDLNVFNKSVVTLDLPEMTDYTEFMNNTVINTTVEHLIINGRTDGTITGARAAFTPAAREAKLKRLTLNCDFSKSTNMYGICSLRTALEIIDGTPVDFSSNTVALGAINLYALKEMRIAPLSIKQSISFAYSPALSDETIQSIIDGLANLTGSTTQTLTFHATVGAKLTDEQKAIVTAKNWTLSY